MMRFYTEIHNDYWNASEAEQPSILSDLPPAHRKAWEVIRMMDGRCGFDHWWGAMDADIQDEIFEELADTIAK